MTGPAGPPTTALHRRPRGTTTTRPHPHGAATTTSSAHDCSTAPFDDPIYQYHNAKEMCFKTAINERLK